MSPGSLRTRGDDPAAGERLGRGGHAGDDVGRRAADCSRPRGARRTLPAPRSTVTCPLDIGLSVAGADGEEPVGARAPTRRDIAPVPRPPARNPPRRPSRSQWSSSVRATPVSASPRKVTVVLSPAGPAPAGSRRKARKSSPRQGDAREGRRGREAGHTEIVGKRGLERRHLVGMAAPAALVVMGTKGDAVAGRQEAKEVVAERSSRRRAWIARARGLGRRCRPRC